jgi:hypothetical protein
MTEIFKIIHEVGNYIPALTAIADEDSHNNVSKPQEKVMKLKL